MGNSCQKALWEDLPTRLLREIVVGKSCGIFLREDSCGKIVPRKSCGKNLAGNSCGKIFQARILRENLVARSCGKILREIVVGRFSRKILPGRSCGFPQDLPARFFPQESSRKIFPQIVAGKSCGKSCGKILSRNAVGHSPYQLQAVFEGNFQNIQFI